MAPIDVKPLSFFLNEQHELSRDEQSGRGSLPKYAPIDWAKKGDRIHRTLRDARKRFRFLPILLAPITTFFSRSLKLP